MRFMMLVKASKESEAGALRARSSSPRWGSSTRRWRRPGADRRRGAPAELEGTRVTFSGSKRTVTDGPFAETKELLAASG